MRPNSDDRAAGLDVLKRMNAAIDELVHVVPYDRKWPEHFLHERARICEALDVLSERLVHIGSTAVEGLAAKPIVDMMLGVPVYPPPSQLAHELSVLGYESLGEAGIAGRLYFRCRGVSAFNVHLVQLGGQLWICNLALRDYLRVNADARTRYAVAKFAAMDSGATQLLAYSQAKADVLQDLVEEALVFRAAGMPHAAQ